MTETSGVVGQAVSVVGVCDPDERYSPLPQRPAPQLRHPPLRDHRIVSLDSVWWKWSNRSVSSARIGSMSTVAPPGRTTAERTEDPGMRHGGSS